MDPFKLRLGHATANRLAPTGEIGARRVANKRAQCNAKGSKPDGVTADCRQ